MTILDGVFSGSAIKLDYLFVIILLTGHTTTNGKHEEEEEKAKIIPWRAQLRKTNSKLNLLE